MEDTLSTASIPTLAPQAGALPGTHSTVRRAVQRDRDAVHALWESAGLSATNDVEWLALTHGAAAKLLVSHDGEQLAGTVVVAYDGWRAYIYHLAVAAFAEGTGLSGALLAEAEGDLRSQGARRAYAEVSEDDAAGYALWASRGFIREGSPSLVKDLRD
jgi:ribosomal protein S18 acetylase RimI-like enzyme